MKRIAVAADHAGFPLKKPVIDFLKNAGYDVIDLGTNSVEADDDYPDFARAIAETILRGDCKEGILLCGSGVALSNVKGVIEPSWVVRFPEIRSAVRVPENSTEPRSEGKMKWRVP